DTARAQQQAHGQPQVPYAGDGVHSASRRKDFPTATSARDPGGILSRMTVHGMENELEQRGSDWEKRGSWKGNHRNSGKKEINRQSQNQHQENFEQRLMWFPSQRTEPWQPSFCVTH
ncbi:hypothetical protein LEMLEM_LOCUS11233, partial [Lemmus lemmus]